jgi:hypothetical protein
MKKLVALLALALLVALPACRKDKDSKKNNRRVTTTRYDDTGKKVYEKKEKAVATKGNMRRNIDTMVDEENLAEGEQRRRNRNQDVRRNENREQRCEHKGHNHYGKNDNRATMLDCDELEYDDLDCEDLN